MVRTGKIHDWGNPAAFQAAEPGVGRDAAIWLYEAGMSVLATDTTGTEPLPFADPAATTHRAMLVDRGVHLLENLYLEDLARDRVTEGLFVNLAPEDHRRDRLLDQADPGRLAAAPIREAYG